jgi:hypothetical protein
MPTIGTFYGILILWHPDPDFLDRHIFMRFAPSMRR